MSVKYKFRDQTRLHFVTFAVVNWIDVFSRRSYRDILVDSLKYCQKEKGLEIYAWCIMTNHVHLIIGTEGRNKLEAILRDFKKFTSQKLIRAIGENQEESRKEWMLWMFERAGLKNSNNKKYQFWRQDNHPIELSTNEMLTSRLDYIHNNPVEAGLVLAPEEYLYSSAKNYSGLETEALVEVMFIE
ncbi:MAG: transposase [Cyclobacteriaceae bacterium]